MTSECSSSCKHSFDITKSKRTRRGSNLTKGEDKVTPASPSDCSEEVEKDAEEMNGRVKLKQFIKVDGLDQDTSREKDKGRAVLSQHFADDKQLQLVIKQPEGGTQNVKFKRIVKRYVKALSHLVRSKRSHHLDKPVLRLTM